MGSKKDQLTTEREMDL